MSRSMMEEQLAQLDSPVDRLWWFAQMERGIEIADIDREPRIGSKMALQRIQRICSSEGTYIDPMWKFRVMMHGR